MDYNERIALVGESRYLNDPLCYNWVHSGGDVKTLIEALADRYDCLLKQWLEKKRTEMSPILIAALLR